MLQADGRVKPAALLDRQCCIGPRVERGEHCNGHKCANRVGFDANRSGVLHRRAIDVLLFHFASFVCLSGSVRTKPAEQRNKVTAERSPLKADCSASKMSAMRPYAA